MVLRFDGTRRPGLDDWVGVEACCEGCCFSAPALARLELVVLMESMAECRGGCDMVLIEAADPLVWL